MRNRNSSIGWLVGEAVVPALTLAFLAAYWWQASPLSFRAKIFPGLVSVSALILIAIRCFAIIRLFLAERAKPDPFHQVGESGSTVLRRPFDSPPLRRLFILILATLVMVFWRELGATVGIYLFLLGALLLLGERNLLVLLILPSLLTVVLVYLFSVVLATLFPVGVFGLF